MPRILAVAHQTADAPEFVAAVKAAAERAPGTEFVLLVPATPIKHLTSWTDGESRAVARQRADTARARLESVGVAVSGTVIGDPDPYQAVTDALSSDEYSAIIVSTYPPGMSRWLGVDLIERLRRSIDLPVTHVVAR